jgi:hypothetical protein
MTSLVLAKVACSAAESTTVDRRQESTLRSFGFRLTSPALAAGVNPGACSKRPCFKVICKQWARKTDQNVSVSAMLQWMIDRAYAKFTLERAEDGLDLGKLHVARPQDAGISRGKVGAQ